jgi:hypothetical protein
MSLKSAALALVTLCLLAGVLLYFLVPPIVEERIVTALETRGAAVVMGGIALTGGGVAVQLPRYAEPGFTLRGVELSTSWGALLAWRSGLSARLEVAELQFEGGPVEKRDPPSVARSLSTLAGGLAAMPPARIEFSVDRIVLPGVLAGSEAALEGRFFPGEEGAADLFLQSRVGALTARAHLNVRRRGAELAGHLQVEVADWASWPAAQRALLEPWLGRGGWQIAAGKAGTAAPWLTLGAQIDWVADDAAGGGAWALVALGDLTAFEAQHASGGGFAVAPSSWGLTWGSADGPNGFAQGTLAASRDSREAPLEAAWELELEKDALGLNLQTGGSAAQVEVGDLQAVLKRRGSAGIFLQLNDGDGQLLKAALPQRLPTGLEGDLRLDASSRLVFEGDALAWDGLETTLSVERVGWPEKNFHAVDLRIRAEGALDRFAKPSGRVNLSLGSVAMNDLAASDIRLRLEREPAADLRLAQARADFAGGSLRLAPLRAPLGALPSEPARLFLEGLDLRELAAYFPQFKGAVEGRISGFLDFAPREGAFFLTGGKIDLDTEEGARLSYDVAGLLSRGAAPGTPRFDHLQRAERALNDLGLRVLSLEVLPETATPHFVRLRIEGESEEDQLIVPLELELNLNIDRQSDLPTLWRLIREGELGFE